PVERRVDLLGGHRAKPERHPERVGSPSSHRVLAQLPAWLPDRSGELQSAPEPVRAGDPDRAAKTDQGQSGAPYPTLPPPARAARHARSPDPRLLEPTFRRATPRVTSRSAPPANPTGSPACGS